MSDTDATLTKILSIEVTDLPPIVAAALESTDMMSALKKQLLKGAEQVDLDSIFGAIVEKLHALLELDLSDVVLAAWNKYELLSEYRDEEKYPPDESVLVTLAKHSLSSEHRPSIQVLANDKEIGALTVTINLTLHLEGAVLRVQDKRVREIRLGEVGGEGRIACEEIEIVSREFDPKSLPGAIILDPGWEIPANPAPQ
jgi:hypothetical protein